jgi:predicted nuclease with TOPRIM domain
MDNNYSELLEKLNELVIRINQFEIDAEKINSTIEKRLISNSVIFDKQMNSFNIVRSQIDKYNNDFREISNLIINDLSEKIQKQIYDGVNDKVKQLKDTVDPLSKSISILNDKVKKIENDGINLHSKLDNMIADIDHELTNFINKLNIQKEKLENNNIPKISPLANRSNLNQDIIDALELFFKSRDEHYLNRRDLMRTDLQIPSNEKVDSIVFKEKARSRMLLYILNSLDNTDNNKKLELIQIYNDFDKRLNYASTNLQINEEYILSIKKVDSINKK